VTLPHATSLGIGLSPWNDVVDQVNLNATNVTAIQALGRAAVKTVPSGNTTSASYANVPATTPTVTFTKSAAATTLAVWLIGEIFHTATGVLVTLGVNIGGTDFDVALRTTAQLNVRQEVSGTIDVPSIAAGSVTVTARWKTASGTLSTSVSSWTLRVQEMI
jgi:hypothetical protein